MSALMEPLHDFVRFGSLDTRQSRRVTRIEFE
jgi:hypothetical protein